MMLRRVITACAVFSATACVISPLDFQQNAAPAAPVRISNQLPFDVAACQSGPVEALPPAVHPEILLGALVTTRPHVMECLMAPTSRGEEKKTQVTLKVRATDASVEHTVLGENLTEEGKACVQKALETQVPVVALPKGSAPVSGELELSHEVGRSLAVTLGENSGSDYSGAVRLGQPRWCECYADYTTRVPPQLKALVKLKHGLEHPEEVNFEPVDTPEGTALATCLQEKMMALPASLPAGGQHFPYNLIHFNSRATEPAEYLKPEVRAMQMEMARTLLSAKMRIALGAHTHASDSYDDVAAASSRRPKDKTLRAELPVKCQKMMDAGNTLVSAMRSLLDADQRMVALLQELKGKDEGAWGAAADQMQEVITQEAQDLANAQKRVDYDKQACAQMK
jgi:hypothetical protein